MRSGDYLAALIPARSGACPARYERVEDLCVHDAVRATMGPTAFDALLASYRRGGLSPLVSPGTGELVSVAEAAKDAQLEQVVGGEPSAAPAAPHPDGRVEPDEPQAEDAAGEPPAEAPDEPAGVAPETGSEGPPDVPTGVVPPADNAAEPQLPVDHADAPPIPAEPNP